MTKTELITAIKDYLNRPNIPADTVASWLSIVSGELNRVLREHPRNLLRASFTQPAGSNLLPLPDDVLQVVRLVSGGAVWTQFPATAVEEADAEGLAFIERGTCLELYPAPTEDTDFFLDYHSAIKNFTDDYSSNWVSLYFPDVYLYGGLREAAVWLKDDQRLALWSAEFMRRLDELSAQGWNQNIGATPRMVPG